MARPIHDTAASTAASARSWLQSLDRSKVETNVPTATLIMWLEALIVAAEPRGAAELQAQGRRTILGLQVEVASAVESQQDRWAQEAETEAARAAEG